jgi:hypothetical protein
MTGGSSGAADLLIMAERPAGALTEAGLTGGGRTATMIAGRSVI